MAERLFVRVRDLGSAYEARFQGKKATCTSGVLNAALAVMEKARSDDNWYLQPINKDNEIELRRAGVIPSERITRNLAAHMEPMYYEVVEKR